MSSKHLGQLQHAYGLFNLSLVTLNYFYCSQILPPPPSLWTHLLLQTYFILSGFHLVYPLLRVKTVFERLLLIILNLISFAPMCLFLVPLHISIINIFYTSHEIIPIGSKYSFVYRLFSSVSFCIWALIINFQASLLISLLMLLHPVPNQSSSWITIICLCIYLDTAPEMLSYPGNQ